MKSDEAEATAPDRKVIFKNTAVILLISAIFYLPGFFIGKFFIGLANLGVFIAVSYLLHNLYMYKVLLRFQQIVLPNLLNAYERVLRWALKGRRPVRLLWELIALFIISIVIYSSSKSKMVFFPAGDPATIYVSIKMPVGTETAVTDSVTKIVEKRVFSEIGVDNPIVEL
jgi:hypothetical protein